MGGPERDRIAEVIADTGDGQPACRGSGYRTSGRAVLTAAHVVSGADRIRVRFNADLPDEWSAPAQVAVADPVSDLAVLSMGPSDPGEAIPPALFGVIGDRAETLDCMAVGFPRFKLREDPQETDGAPVSRYRDSHQANGTISPLANWREGTLEMLVPAPAPDPDPYRHSPWEGMSGAAVWCKGRIIGAVSKHHPGDGLGALAVARIDQLYRSLDPLFLDSIPELAGLPAGADQLVDVSDFLYAGEMECPYIGLPPFVTEDARFFFGREGVIARLLEALAAGPLIALIGASGSGKSSVLSAGLIPAASASGDPQDGYHCVRITPTADPIGQLEDALSLWSGTSVSGLLDDAPAKIADTLAIARPPQPLLLIVDQMEELHTLCDDERARREFIRGLLTVIDGDNTRNRVVIAVRTDFYAQCRDDPDLGPKMRDREVDLWPMGKTELRSAIERPAALVGLRVDPRLREMLLEDVGDEPGKLPLLSHALRASFKRRQGSELTVEDYIAIGRVKGAVSETAEEAYADLDWGQKKVAKSIFMLCTAGGGKIPYTRRPLPRSDFDPECFPGADAVLDGLAAARLLTLAKDRSEEQTVEIAHEALIRFWTRLETWLEDSSAQQELRQDLITAAGKWHKSERSSGWLYHGANLEEARKLLAGHSPIPLPLTAREFLAASQAEAKRRSRRFRFLAVGLAVALLLASVGVAAAVTQFGQKNAQQRIAAARQVVGEIASVGSTNPGLARQLLAAARRVAATDQTTGALLTSLSIPREYDFRGLVRAAAYSPRAPLLAVGTDQGLTLMDASTGAVISNVSSTGYISAVAFSPRGGLLATGGRDGDVRLWNISDPAHPRLTATLRFQEAIISVLTFGLSGMLAVTLDNNAVGLFNTNDLAVPVLLHVFPGYDTAPLYPGMALSPDGHVLAVGGPNDTVQLWDITSPAHPIPLASMAGPSPAVDALAFSPDGHLLAAAADLNSTVRVWDVTDSRHPELRPGLASGAMDGAALAFSPRGHTLAVAAGNGIQLWNLGDPVNPSQVTTLTGHSNTVNTVAFSPDGQTLATGSDDQTLCLWDIADAGNSIPLADISANASTPAVFSPDGHLMVVGNPPVLWDVSNPAKPVELTPFPTGIAAGTAQQVAFSPGGQMVAGEGNDGTITLWDLSHLRHPKALARLRAQPGALAFTGRRTLDDAIGTTIRRWDIRVPARPVAISSLSVPSALGQPPFMAGSAALLSLAEPAGPGALTSLAEHHRSATLLALSPGGRTLATAASGQPVTLWNVSQSPATQLTTLSAAGTVPQAVFSPDGNALAFVGPQGISLWDIANIARPAIITTLTTNGFGFAAATFNPAGDLLATVGQDGTVQLWDMKIPRILQRLCSGIGAAITRAQWNHYVPGIPYNKPCPTQVPAEAPGTVQAAATPSAISQPAASSACSARYPPARPTPSGLGPHAHPRPVLLRPRHGEHQRRSRHSVVDLVGPCAIYGG